MRVLPVDIWSDIACPWCWVGKRNLERAVETFAHPVQVTWHAFELDPSAEPASTHPVDYLGKLARKYGVTRGQAAAMIERMVQTGASVGLDFRFDRICPGNTFDAHRLLHHAAEHGSQGELKERLFRAYLHEGQAISEHAVLAALASEVGLDVDQVSAVLAGDDHAEGVRLDEHVAGRIGISGVPFFLVGRVYAVPGAQPPKVLLNALQRAWGDGLGDTVELEGAPECGPDSCAV